MFIIVGLGNPGKKFEETPHNVGFTAVDFFAAKNQFPPFELQKKYLALVSQENVAGKNVVLAKPETFMNESGKAVKKLLENSNARLIVVHDDIDLALGKLKIVKDRGSAGHKGIESIIEMVGNDNMVRFRIGIAINNELAEEVVLKKFSKDQQKVMSATIKKTVEALEYFITNDLEKTMNEYNR